MGSPSQPPTCLWDTVPVQQCRQRAEPETRGQPNAKRLIGVERRYEEYLKHIAELAKRAELAHIAIDGIRLRNDLPIHFEHRQSAKRRVRLATLLVRGRDAIVLERDFADRESESCRFSASTRENQSR
jgi:hypothetical protein